MIFAGIGFGFHKAAKEQKRLEQGIAIKRMLYLLQGEIRYGFTPLPEPYRRQKGWERIRNDNEPDNSMDGFQEIPTEEMEQLGLPEEWLKQK